MAYSIIGGWPIIIHSTNGWRTVTTVPEIEIKEEPPRFRNWPRDCTVITEAKVVLNCDRSKRGEIYKWMNTNGIEYKPMHNHSFILHDQETLTMFKLAWL
jgi:hypothetical protein